MIQLLVAVADVIEAEDAVQKKIPGLHMKEAAALEGAVAISVVRLAETENYLEAIMERVTALKQDSK